MAEMPPPVEFLLALLDPNLGDVVRRDQYQVFPSSVGAPFFKMAMMVPVLELEIVKVRG